MFASHFITKMLRPESKKMIPSGCSKINTERKCRCLTARRPILAHKGKQPFWNLGMAQHQPIRRNTPPSGSDIPDKLYFRIGEVSRLCDIPAYVLRFWESEFPQLKPHKGGTGQRLYRRRDVETVLHIKSLLYDEGYTIPGARQALKTEQRQKTSQLPLGIETGPDPTPQLRKLHKEMRELLAHLSKPPARPAIQSIRSPRSAGPTSRRPAADKLFDPGPET
jgi:DNA-binding transcriptional MerR regulator